MVVSPYGIFVIETKAIFMAPTVLHYGVVVGVIEI
ncbi:MAG: hypothetical protein II970_04605 [Paludibacteraceae bacterium]|nr:hypothetical protein [Paludibacteraceae bacterium]